MVGRWDWCSYGEALGDDAAAFVRPPTVIIYSTPYNVHRRLSLVISQLSSWNRSPVSLGLCNAQVRGLMTARFRFAWIWRRTAGRTILLHPRGLACSLPHRHNLSKLLTQALCTWLQSTHTTGFNCFLLILFLFLPCSNNTPSSCSSD